MSARMRWIVVVAALAVPVAVWAQHRVAGAVLPSVVAASPVAPAGVDSPAPDDDEMTAEELAVLGFDDELLALGDDGDDGPDERIVDRRVHRIVGRHPGNGRGMRGGPMGHGFGLHARWGALDLSDDQRSKLQALHETQARKAVQRRADMQLARIDLHKLMREDRPNMASVNSQIDKLARLHAEGLKARFETHMQARALLTPDQVKKLRDGMPGMRHEMGDYDM